MAPVEMRIQRGLLISGFPHSRGSSMARILTVIGTRPEVIKMAPVVKALDRLGHEHVLVHSGQHYDLFMDRIFFRDMELREPQHRFELHEESPPLQVATTMGHLTDLVPTADLVVVHGDTNTTLAGALVGSKEQRPVAHVEAGIRSFDKTMPEEVNRIVTDQLSDLLFAPTPTAVENLRRENVVRGVHAVGNSVVDALTQNLPLARRTSKIRDQLDLATRGYLLLTFHRAENVDPAETLGRSLTAFEAAAEESGLPIIFPIHPRTARRLRESGLEKQASALPRLRRIEPVGYLDMLTLEKDAALILTDSGGLQEEACILHVPCVTLRENTERPETLTIGSNVLAGTDPARVRAAVRKQLAVSRSWSSPYGDGTTSSRIASLVDAFLGG